MKNIIIICFSIFIICSCSSPTSKNNIVNEKQTSISIEKGFTLNGKLSSYFSDKVYLNKILENRLYPVDSTSVINNVFQFNGIVEYPERYALTFENYSSTTIVILENKVFSVELNPKNIQDPIIKNSELNSEMIVYKNESKEIFKQIDYLFPQFQKARLENDSDKLDEIGLKIKNIEKEHKLFTFEFILKHKNSFIAPMLLRDQLKSTEIDSLRIQETFNLLSENVKHSPDSQLIEQYLTNYN